MKPPGSEKLYVVPCSKERASEFITYLHRHHMPLEFGSYCLAVCTGDGVVHGVAVIGRTTTQHFDEKEYHNNSWVQEVRRVATDGFPNACSCLYGACWRFVSALGYTKLISYTLPEEGGASLRALGWRRVDNVGGNSWAHRSIRGTDIAPTGRKTRWEIEKAPEKKPPFRDLTWPIFGDNPQLSLLDGPTLDGQGVGARIQKEMFVQSGFFDNDGQAETFGVEYVEQES